ncbi:hypothetical protein PHYPSEUDO_008189 [Phytophthora pseudosyringae]|uniref:Uncharacterized protein n=1 Tax=Phytophthora pseudosyringae TaxID=221518 RepID=A0A8T1WAT5_9STRA|nr:hypothetical protein PHYPSEUDO_008189 [Phytophthora pseudosyringae]
MATVGVVYTTDGPVQFGRVAGKMVKRRGLFKLKVQLPSDDEDNEREVKREVADSSDSSFDGSTSGSQAETKGNKDSRKSGNSSSSSGSSSQEDSDVEEKPRGRTHKVAEIKMESSSEEEDSSASDLGSSESEESEAEEETPRKKNKSSSNTKKSLVTTVKKQRVTRTKKTNAAKAKKKKSGSNSLKRLKRMRMSGSSSDENSELEESQPLDTNDSVKLEVDKDADDTEEEMDMMKEEAVGSDTDLDEDWQPPSQDEEAGADAELTKKRDRIVEDNDDEWRGDEWEEEDMPTDGEKDEEVCAGDVAHAKFVLRNITIHVPLLEETAIRRGVKLSGPPREFATTHSDEYARFSQDPSEILEDYEVMADIRQSQPNPREQDVPKESPFAQVPRPIVALAAEALHRSSRKRKRIARSKNCDEHAPSAAALLNTARTAGQFGDHFVESLLSANGKALQGIGSEFDYDKRCWSSLPTKKKPIANWRFVLEHVQKTLGTSDSDDAICPPMKQKTLERITKRLKKLYGYTTQHEEYDVFAGEAPTSSNNAEDTAPEEQASQDSE